MKQTLLRMQAITKIYPGVTALDRVDFDLESGEVHVLLGENGAGKSTLVKILSGAVRKTSGTIELSGRTVDIAGPAHARGLGIGIIYQELNLVPHLSAGENIFLGREQGPGWGVISQERLMKEAQNGLDGLDLNLDARTPVSALGVAEQQMVEIVRALSIDARILIMDEPTSALSDVEIDRLFATLAALKKRGVGVIYISHRMEELFTIGDRVTVLRDGRVAGRRTIAETSREDLVRLMVNRELEEQYPRIRPERGEPVLEGAGLSRSGSFTDVTFTLHRGEILGMAGLMGSGRTEIARALFGIDRLDSGTVRIHGRETAVTDPGAAIGYGMGFLTEDRKSQGLVLDLSVRENITLPGLKRFTRMGLLRIHGEKETAQRFIRELRIRTPGMDRKTLYLSGGNQQKVVLAKWLCSLADILIFDEPTRGIDVGSKVEIYQWMNQLTAAGAAILMISSELPEILGMSDRIIVIHRGRVAAELSSEEATQERILHYAIGE
ncbi:sugar ABC transporter ATP-binding protein [bacterium]|nr:sugar ABC transporter ATP-binding protein [bacterium]